MFCWMVSSGQSQVLQSLCKDSIMALFSNQWNDSEVGFSKCQRKRGASWDHSSGQSKGRSDLSWLHDLFLHLGSGFLYAALHNFCATLCSTTLSDDSKCPALAGKFGAIFASIPFPIFAALYCLFFGLVGEQHRF